jgi:hypothetical protein
MFDQLCSLIDSQAVESALEHLVIPLPDILTPEDTHCSVFPEPARISLVQINYREDSLDSYEAGKIYVNINALTEVAFTSAYAFHALNFYRESEPEIIHSYGPEGTKVATYHINRQVLSNCLDKEVYMTKSTGNLYLPPYKRHEDALIDAVRDQWFMAERLLCYSLKFDGRISFYIIINRELGYRFSASHFVPQM